jgi:hypothetical protein
MIVEIIVFVFEFLLISIALLIAYVCASSKVNVFSFG